MFFVFVSLPVWGDYLGTLDPSTYSTGKITGRYIGDLILTRFYSLFSLSSPPQTPQLVIRFNVRCMLLFILMKTSFLNMNLFQFLIICLVFRLRFHEIPEKPFRTTLVWPPCTRPLMLQFSKIG